MKGDLSPQCRGEVVQKKTKKISEKKETGKIVKEQPKKATAIHKSRRLKKAFKSNSFSCSFDDLKNKDCYINAFNYSIYFSAKKIRFSNGRWRSLINMPEHGKDVDWHAIRFFKRSERLFLEFFLWALPEHGKVQSLFWDIYEIKNIKMKRVLSEIIQKRRKNITEWRAKDYIYDEKVRYGLQTLKDGKIKWFVKNKEGVF